jgi:hypothetical protein
MGLNTLRFIPCLALDVGIILCVAFDGEIYDTLSIEVFWLIVTVGRNNL